MYRMDWTWDGIEHSYEVTDEDELNLARAVQFEGKPQSAILWTLLQRYAMLRSSGFKNSYPTLTSFLKAYVQPINPRWFPSGDLHQEEVQRLLDAGKVNDAELEERRAIQREAKARTPWDKISPENRRLVRMVLQGNRKTSAAPLANHYWASRATAGLTQEQARKLNQAKKPALTLLDVGAGWLQGVNVFFTSATMTALKNLSFQKLGPEGVLGGLVVAGLLGFMVYRAIKG